MSNFKKMVQARIGKTGERWSTAAGHLRAGARTADKAHEAPAITASLESGAFVFDGTSSPPDGDGFFVSDGTSALMGPFIRAYISHHVFVDLDEGRRRLGVTTSNPPVTGGFVIDTFEHPEASQAELLAAAAGRNGPLRIQYANGELGESFPATASGLDEACMLCGALAKHGREIRLVTSRGVMIKRWSLGPPKPFRSIEIGENGASGPRHFDGECPKCNAPMEGVIPTDKASIEFTCAKCGGTFVATRQ